MTDQSNRSPEENDTVSNRVDQLVSALLDHAISDGQIRELGVLIEQDIVARRRYVENMQLHADLVEHFNDKRPTPVLGSLGDTTGIPSASVVIPPIG